MLVLWSSISERLVGVYPGVRRSLDLINCMAKIPPVVATVYILITRATFTHVDTLTNTTHWYTKHFMIQTKVAITSWWRGISNSGRHVICYKCILSSKGCICIQYKNLAVIWREQGFSHAWLITNREFHRNWVSPFCQSWAVSKAYFLLINFHLSLLQSYRSVFFWKIVDLYTAHQIPLQHCWSNMDISSCH